MGRYADRPRASVSEGPFPRLRSLAACALQAGLVDETIETSQAILDLGLQKTFNLGGDVGLDIGLQLLNALNEDAAEYFASWLLFPGQDFEDASWVSPRRLQIKLKLAF